MRKCIALLLCLLLIVLLLPVHAEEVVIYSFTADEQAVLKAIGVWEDTQETLSQTVTRGEFAEMISKVAFSHDSVPITGIENIFYSDVFPTTSSYDVIISLTVAGYASGYNGYFRPDDVMTVAEALTMAVKTLDYTKIANSGMLPFATKKRIDKGLMNGADNSLSKYDTLKIIYNLAKADISDLVYEDSPYNGDVFFMEKRTGIYCIESVVTDNSVTSLYGKTEISEGRIKLETGDILIDKAGQDMLGKNICGYFCEDENGNDVLLSCYERRNDILRIKSDDINGYSDRYYTYETDSGKSKRQLVPTNASVIYNSECISLNDKFNEEMFVPELGTVIFIDNDSDGKCDVLIIDDYIDYQVSTVDADNEVIYLKDEVLSLDLSRSVYSITDSENKKVEIFDVVENSIVSVAKSLSGDVYKIKVSALIASDTINSIDSDENVITTALGAEFNLSKGFLKKYQMPKLGFSYVMYINAFGSVAKIEDNISENDWYIGMLSIVGFGSGTLRREVVFEIFSTDDTLEYYKAADKVKIYMPDGTEEKVKKNDLIAMNLSGVIRYKLNFDKKISVVELPLDFGVKPAGNDRLFTIFETQSTDKSAVNYNANYRCLSPYNNVRSYGGMALSNADTYILEYVWDDVSATEEYIHIQNNDVPGDTSPVFKAYGTDYKSKFAKYMTFAKDEAPAFSNYPMLVTNVKKQYDDETCDVIYVISGWFQGVQVSYYMTESDYNAVSDLRKSGKYYKIASGDILKVSKKNNYIKAHMIYDADGIAADMDGSTIVGAVAGSDINYVDYTGINNFGNPLATSDTFASYSDAWKPYNGQNRIISGWIYNVQGDFVTITTQNLSETDYDPDLGPQDGYVNEVYYMTRSGVAVTMYGRNIIDAKLLQNTDIKPFVTHGNECSRVVVVLRTGSCMGMFVFND